VDNLTLKDIKTKSQKMANITYYFGAGASKAALPIVDEIPKRIENLIPKIEAFKNDFSSSDYR
jgi:hypothetical protein